MVCSIDDKDYIGGLVTPSTWDSFMENSGMFGYMGYLSANEDFVPELEKIAEKAKNFVDLKNDLLKFIDCRKELIKFARCNLP